MFVFNRSSGTDHQLYFIVHTTFFSSQLPLTKYCKVLVCVCRNDRKCKNVLCATVEIAKVQENAPRM